MASDTPPAGRSASPRRLRPENVAILAEALPDGLRDPGFAHLLQRIDESRSWRQPGRGVLPRRPARSAPCAARSTPRSGSAPRVVHPEGRRHRPRFPRHPGERARPRRHGAGGCWRTSSGPSPRGAASGRKCAGTASTCVSSIPSSPTSSCSPFAITARSSSSTAMSPSRRHEHRRRIRVERPIASRPLARHAHARRGTDRVGVGDGVFGGLKALRRQPAGARASLETTRRNRSRFSPSTRAPAEATARRRRSSRRSSRPRGVASGSPTPTSPLGGAPSNCSREAARRGVDVNALLCRDAPTSRSCAMPGTATTGICSRQASRSSSTEPRSFTRRRSSPTTSFRSWARRTSTFARSISMRNATS